MQVLIVGAGVSGLTAGHVLLRDDFDVTIIDKQQHGVGGCWNQAFDFVTVQTTREEYRMPGRPFPPGTPRRPGRRDVLDYWNGLVADDPALAKSIQLGTELLSLRRARGDPCSTTQRGVEREWVAELKDVKGGGTRLCTFDFVIVATGLYGTSELAHKPKLEGADQFPGDVSHPASLGPHCKPREDERVAVVGFGPTALAYASHWADAGCETHLIVRDRRWFIPSRLLGGLIPHTLVIFSRVNAMMLPSHKPVVRAERILHTHFSFLVTMFWRVMEIIIILSALPPRKLSPPLGQGLRALRCAIPVLPMGFMGHCRSGRIRLHVEKVISTLQPDGSVHLSDGSVIPGRIDRVFLATGYELPSFSWMDERLRRSVLARGRQLYRGIVAPGETGIAFVGFSSSFMGCVTEYVQAHWISSLLKGDIRLPSIGDMEAFCADAYEWSRKSTLFEAQQVYCINARHFQYMERLLADMGIDGYRTSVLNSLLSQWGPDNYASIFSERRRVGNESS